VKIYFAGPLFTPYERRFIDEFAVQGIVGLVTDLRALRDSEREGEARGLNLFVVGCIEAAGTICTSLDAAQAVLESWNA
jgi:hypothetical protein